jgi:hypothetical protein
MMLTRGPARKIPTDYETVRWALENDVDPDFWWREVNDIKVGPLIEEASAAILRGVEGDARFYGAAVEHPVCQDATLY